MSKFNAIVKGAAARQRGVKFSALTGAECVCDLRVLLGEDDDLIIQRAREHTLKRGGKAENGDATYEFAKACEILALAAVDSESPVDAPQPYFESAEVVRKNLDRDRINYLVELQRDFQLTCWPRKIEFTEEEYWAKVVELAALAEGEKCPLDQWPPSLRLIFERSTAKRLLFLEMSKSGSSTISSAPASANTPSSPASFSE